MSKLLLELGLGLTAAGAIAATAVGIDQLNDSERREIAASHIERINYCFDSTPSGRGGIIDKALESCLEEPPGDFDSGPEIPGKFIIKTKFDVNDSISNVTDYAAELQRVIDAPDDGPNVTLGVAVFAGIVVIEYVLLANINDGDK